MWNRLIGLNNCHWVVLHRRLRRWSLHSYNAGLGGVVIPGNEDEVAGRLTGGSSALMMER